MSYWHDTMHDDVFLVMNEGWVGASKPRAARIIGKTNTGANKYEDAHLKRGTGKNTERYVMDLLPPELIAARYFGDEQREVDELSATAEATTQAVVEFTEEHGIEDGAVWDAVNDSGKLTQAAVKAELKAAKESDDGEAVAAYQQALDLLKAEADAKKSAKDAQAALDSATLKQYGELTEADVQTLVLEAKWAATIVSRVSAEVETMTLALVGRIQELGARYAETVGALNADLAELESRVHAHLVAMGVEG
jgi:type I restriction enzyme M protein